jgi:hypothetical protein
VDAPNNYSSHGVAAQRADTTPNGESRERNYAMENTVTEIDYVQVGDYLLPAIKLQDIPAERKERPLGRYARQYREYLRTWRPILYSRLVLSEKLFPMLWEIDDAAQTRLDNIADPDIAREVIISELF